MAARRLNDRFEGWGRQAAGSALILTVVLTSLLALVGVLFIMAARLDRMGTTAASESRELDNAVDTVVAQISEALADDVPGVTDDQELYDFPDANNPWLADLEPVEASAGNYVWRQVSNLTGTASSATRDVSISLIGQTDAIADVNSLDAGADADGDGVSDSLWYRVGTATSSKGKPIYAAVRIVDNGGMLNINTGYWFNPVDATDRARVDGRNLAQINAVALAGGSAAALTNAGALLAARGIADTVNGLTDYEAKVVWGYRDPTSAYTPFDLSDELELRYRYLLNRTGVDTRAEDWAGRFRDDTISTPVDANLPTWFARVAEVLDPNGNYAYRHIATTYNMDRLLMAQKIQYASRPRSAWKRINVNETPADAVALRDAISLALGETDPDPVSATAAAAQITASLIDYADTDDDVTAVPGWGDTPEYYYGFERPCIYISEVARRIVPDPEDPNVLHESYAVELFKPYFEDNDPATDQWQLVVTSPTGERRVHLIDWSGTRRLHVLLTEDPVAELFDPNGFSDPAAAVDTTPYDHAAYADPQAQTATTELGGDKLRFEGGDTLSLERYAYQTQVMVPDVDLIHIPEDWAIDPNGGPQSIQRDVSPYTCVRRQWTLTPGVPTLGTVPEPNFVDQVPAEIIQAHPANRPLVNIGEIGMVFAKSAYDNDVVKDALPGEVLFDLTNPRYARVLNYLTVIDPADHIPDPNETRIMGRININTAPSFVLGQLPWMQYEDQTPLERAEAIVADRNLKGAYESSADLMRVSAMWQLASDAEENWFGDSPKGPDLDLTPDMALDDFEERDLIFQRISDLVTVRSDVFTAYILVRIGTDGPQRRVLAILDRSGVTPSGGDVRIVALHPVADPR